MFVFKNTSRFFIKVLTRRCNLSMTIGIFHSSLSIAEVKCMYKSGDRSNLSNYRPISLLPSYGIFLEKAIVSQMIKQLETFFTDLSTIWLPWRKKYRTPVHSLVRNNHNDMNGGKFVIGIFLDLKNALDSLNRKII